MSYLSRIIRMKYNKNIKNILYYNLNIINSSKYSTLIFNNNNNNVNNCMNSIIYSCHYSTLNSNNHNNMNNNTHKEIKVFSFMDKVLLKHKPIVVPQPNISLKLAAFSGIISFIGIISLSAIHIGLSATEYMLLGSFGASAVLIFGAPAVPFSQPRNVIGGHMISAIVSISVFKLLGASVLACPIAVSLSIFLMAITKTIHPPAGGTALIMILGSQQLQELGYLALAPTFSGSIILIATGLLNNLIQDRSYPTTWWK